MNNISFFRFRFLKVTFSILATIIILQMARIQTSASGQMLSKEGNELYTYEFRKVYPERGNIYDRNGHLLAGNLQTYQVGFDLRYNKNANTVAAALASTLGLDYSTVLGLASIPFEEGKSVYVVLADFVTSDKIDAMEKYWNNLRASAKLSQADNPPSMAGLQWTPHLQRSYPEKSLASNIIGFYSFKDREEGLGYFGVEEKYDDILSGEAKKVLLPKDPYLMEDISTVPPGASIKLTIDREIQAMLEKVVDKAIKESKSESGTIIVSNPRNGEILGIATTPRMNLNQYWDYSKDFPNPTPFNRAVGQTYEPGSVFKVLTMASALDAGSVKPDTPFKDTGSIDFDGINIFNWNRGGFGDVDMVGCMQHSINVCLAWVAKQMGQEKFYQYMQAFGIGHRTNVDLAGEVVWPLSLPGDSNWFSINLGTNAFGQGVAVTPMQMVMSVSAVANEGRMMTPHVLHSVIEKDQQYIVAPQMAGTPITQNTARTLTEMLAKSLELEASNAMVEGYRVAGKTGTAEIPTPAGYTSSLTNASFVGWGPADDPQFLVYIWLEKPQTSPWGSVVAAPVFSEVVKNLVVLMDIPPDATRLQLAVK